VRAVDRAGNRSATTARLTAPSADEPSLPLIEAGSDWRWRFQRDGTVPADWREPGADVRGWAEGAAPLGFGSTGLATNIDVAGGSSDRPLSALFRRDFSVEDPAAVGSMTLTTYADDGVVVYVNGTEVGRANMPTGTLTLDSFATAAPRTATARANPVSFTVPRSLLREGTNTIAAQTHLNWRATPDISFDLSGTSTPRDPDAPPPAQPTLEADAIDETTVGLTWSHDPDSDVVGYRVARDGADVAYVPAPGTSYRDEGLSPGTTYDYSLRAVDSVGTASPPATASVTTPAAPEPPLVSEGSTWRWLFQRDGTVPADWREPSFDASGWSLGAAPLGFGSAVIATNIDVTGGSSNRPLSALFRRDVTIEDPAAIGALTLTTYADDGVVVYVNGTEVGRANMPTGTLTLDSFATAAPRTATARANPVSFTVPRSLLREGTNTIAAQTHLNWRATPDISFDLSATREDG
jgi:trimeric autotransporter adhesin